MIDVRWHSWPRNWRCLFLVGCALLSSSPVCVNGSDAAPPARTVRLPASVHPCLLLDSNGVAQLKDRIAACSWAKDSWERLRKAAEKSLAQPLELPPRGGNWSHNYVCPVHGARLTQGRRIGAWQWEHTCPVGPHVLRGNAEEASLDFDGNAISGIHGRLAQEVVDDGLVYQVTGDPRYARKAREILLAYAARYLDYPLHDNQGKKGRGGRVASQSLTEASWLIAIAQGADLVWTTLTDEDRAEIEHRLLRPALDQVILPRRLGIHNIQCRHNSAIGLVGFLLGDPKLVEIAINDPLRGFRAQLEKGVLGDGMWLEGASGYHFFTIQGLWPLAEAARNCGIDLYTDQFGRMFEGPLALAMPDLVLPNFNDSGLIPLERQADLYELGYARLHSPACLKLLRGSDRAGRLALLYGAKTLAEADAKAAASRSRNLEASGYAILQAGEGSNATWLCLKYGPHGGGHGHPDKNSFILYSRGEIMGVDPGTHAYGSPLHRDWDKTTLAHNTLVADERSQTPATGKCLAFGSEQQVQYAVIEAGPIYSNLTFTRTVAMLDHDLVVFIDQVKSSTPRVLDLAYHQVGTWSRTDCGMAGAKPWSSSLQGYSRLTGCVEAALPANGFALQTSLDKNRSPRLILAGGEETEVIAGYGIFKTTRDLVPTIIQRRKTTDTAFVWAVSIDGSRVDLGVAPLATASGKILPAASAVAVTVQKGAKKITLLANPVREAVSIPGSKDTSTALVTVR